MSVAPRIPVSYPDPGFPLVAVASVGTSERLGRYHLHTAADWELCYVSSGQTNLLVGGRKRCLCAGEVLVIRPDEPHATAPTRGRRHTLIFRQRLLRAMPFRARAGAAVGIEVAGKRLSGLLTVVSQRRPAVEHLLERLEQESFGSEATKQAMCAALLAELLLELARSAKEAGQPRQSPVSPIARRTVEQLCAEVQAELDHPWTLKEFVKRSGYSATQLCLLFDRVTGLSPCHWLSQERVRRARELLAQSEKSATEIAVEVGFGSRSQFYRTFHKAMRTGPSRYRAIVRHQQ